MKSISANDAKTKFGDLLTKVQREPIQIKKNGFPVAVILSCEEYKQLEALRTMLLKSRFEKAEATAFANQLADADAFLNTLPD